MKGNKYRYLAVIQGNYGYGHGWEDESQYSGPARTREARRDIKEYRLACQDASYRIVERRELNEEQVE